MPSNFSNLNNVVFCVLNFVILLNSLAKCFANTSSEDLNLPESHVVYHLNRLSRAPGVKECWGYEDDCDRENHAFSQPECPGEHSTYVKDKATQRSTFFSQADFGFVRQQIREQSVICEPLFRDDSSLECSKYLRFCSGRNILVNFTDFQHRREPVRYHMDVLKEGEIAGHCTLHVNRLREELGHLSPLQSWAPELRFFSELPQRPIESGQCDVIVTQPTVLLKLDASINMYHHFCDFFNLYASLHVNTSNGRDFDPFGRDVRILIWETYKYISPFAETFEAFTKNPLWDLNTFRGKTVCFKNLMLPLLPRMIFGLFYNTPIIQGCEKSGLFRAFSEFVLHRLQIPLHPRTSAKVRVTFLSRGTKYRRVLNEEELMERLRQDDRFDVQNVAYGSQMKFREQLEITRNTDVFIGMHGAGLTHLLFLPNWASIFELYNCEDPTCYLDLARLRGINYVTWEDAEKLQSEDDGSGNESGAYAKFTNYFFDAAEFMRLVHKAADHVEHHEEFRSASSQYLSSEKDHEEL
ncbi:EGF domain-specific O-linked N-acetylglucosamine transferase [Phlebotomus argentipes]|uniref:EGF domain-specific O-linked N-acetylglucosamine transferase n=1 Tax=Phlebotomus argentipes TaxID=94469 RepID=UPI00289326C4|nr:EGF domain-specific O-linked N-acetylglucosamine transferase [Phlebotomus argentipes]